MAIIKVFGAIFDPSGRILLVRRNDLDHNWTTPGGKLEPGETPEAGLVRLTLKETGLKVTPKQLIGVYSAPFKDHIFIFLEAEAEKPRETSAWKPNEQITDIGYFEHDHLPTPMYQRTLVRLNDAFESRLGIMRTLDNR